jgi:putative endonuclease
MAEHNELGKLGEEMAVEFLRKDGYTILQTNYTFQKAEIDILAQKKTHLLLCRSQNAFFFEFGLPQDFVKPKKSSFLLKLLMPL